MARPSIRRLLILLAIAAVCLPEPSTGAQDPTPKTNSQSEPTAEVTARLTPGKPAPKHGKFPPAVLWFKPLAPSGVTPPQPGAFTLTQRNKMFHPHLLIVPTGSSVAFPNQDPFFHNVFSLFDGKRFDLGLYEAGSTRSVLFSREGVSYIFCNIHSEMSAIVISLSTPIYAVATADGAFRIKNVPAGDYELHLWIEGQRQNVQDRLTRRVHITGQTTDLGEFPLDLSTITQHLNKFGRPYEPDANPIY
jgi:hypothetical protein